MTSLQRAFEHIDQFAEQWLKDANIPGLAIAVRKGVLTLIRPWGTVEPMQPLGEGLFHLGADKLSPESLRFQAVVEGRALRADYSGCPYYRAFTR